MRRLRLAFLLAALSSCSSDSWEMRALPIEIRVDSVLDSSAGSGFREGCASAAYRLSEDVARAIESKGLSYFPEYSGDDPHGGWRETPGEIDYRTNGHGAKVTFYGLYAIGGCDNAHHPSLHSLEIGRALQQPGSYYRSGGNLEQIIVIVPRERLAGYYAFG